MVAAQLLPADALDGIRLGVSVSDSADLATLGLSPRHAELAVAEIARAVLVGGGTLVYGGRVKPSGFTQFLMHEVRRYGHSAAAMTLCLAAPEHRKLSRTELDDLDRELGTKGRVVCLDEAGAEIEDFLSSASAEPEPVTDIGVMQASYSSLRRYLGEITDARVILGGQLCDFKGAMPGVIEEAIIAVQAGHPLYVASGFGGAAALAAQALDIDDLDWAPDGLPDRPKDHRIDESLHQLRKAARAGRWSTKTCGLDDIQLRQLAASYRPGEIASLVVNGLAHLRE